MATVPAYRRALLYAAVACSVIFAVAAIAPPLSFPAGDIVVIAHGETVPEIAQVLAETRIISHPTFLRFILRIFGSATSVQAGAYRFYEPQNALTIAYRISTGDYGLPPARITLVEGGTAREYAVKVAEALPGVSAKDFLAAGERYEGYLFPDTYNFPPGSDANSVVASMRSNFDSKIQPLTPLLRSSGHSLSDIVTMASLIEKEARTKEERRVIAGILWHRLALHMPLQVDAVFGYIFSRATYSPSFDDLKVDSPYNTYTHTGLPPGPIGNPGQESIEAALNPTKTDYLYYLTGKDGRMHYAVTYAAHQANQARYLK